MKVTSNVIIVHMKNTVAITCYLRSLTEKKGI